MNISRVFNFNYLNFLGFICFFYKMNLGLDCYICIMIGYIVYIDFIDLIKLYVFYRLRFLGGRVVYMEN